MKDTGNLESAKAGSVGRYAARRNNMIKVLSLFSFLALASGIARADTIVAGSWVNVPESISNPSGGGAGCGSSGGSQASSPTQCGFLGTGPYWDNDSGKGANMNLGYFLTGTGGYTSDSTPACPIATCQYLSSGPGSSSASNIIALDHSTAQADLTLLGDSTGNMTDEFGVYNASLTGAAAVASEHLIYGPGSMSADIGNTLSISGLLSLGEDFGFYLTESCVYGSANYCPAGDPTPGLITLFSNASLNMCTSLDPTCTTDQHFAIFQSSTGVFEIGMEDWGMLGGVNNGEANGDFNDIVFQLVTDPPATAPEPATFGLIGLGLLSVGLFRNRARKTGTR
jgi:hypothetical protein